MISTRALLTLSAAGFAAMNWTARRAALGGIYGRAYVKASGAPPDGTCVTAADPVIGWFSPRPHPVVRRATAGRVRVIGGR